MPGARRTTRLALGLEGAGWHPAAWRSPDADSHQLSTAGYWVGLAREAERGWVDFVTIEDSLGSWSPAAGETEGRVDLVRGRLDAVLTAARVAPATSRVGLVPTIVATHTEPFHISKAIATLDYVSGGRAGVRVDVSARQQDADNFGRRRLPPASAALAELWSEAADHIEVMRRLWDSWEDDAEIRDVASGRFVDRRKLHHINFRGDHFAVRGPSITPRPPQGQPIVAAHASRTGPASVVGGVDVAFVAPQHVDDARALVADARGNGPSHFYADLIVYLDQVNGAAYERRARLDDLLGYEPSRHAAVFAGTPARLADLIADWTAVGVSGVRLLPGTIPHDLLGVTRGLVPELCRRGVYQAGYGAATLRGVLGLPRPANRHAAA